MTLDQNTSRISTLTMKHPGALGSSGTGLRRVPRTRTKQSEATVSYCAPHLWNKFPEHLRSTKSVSSFKSGLKSCVVNDSSLFSMHLYSFHTFLCFKDFNAFWFPMLLLVLVFCLNSMILSTFCLTSCIFQKYFELCCVQMVLLK